MSSICGYWTLNSLDFQTSVIESMNSRLNHWNADKTGEWTEGPVALGHLMLYNTPESLSEILPYFDAKAQLCITADARIDNREELTQKLNLSENSTKTKPDSWFILSAYQQWGENCTQYLKGDFAFAIWDQNNQKLFCARDQIGIKPLFYYFKDGLFAFATEMKGILALENVDSSINQQWVGDFLANIKSNRTSSFYQHINRLEAAHQLVLEHGKIRIEKYWELDTTNRTYFSNESDYTHAFLEKLEKAIERRLRSNGEITSELSGGLDSSLLTAYASKLLHEKGKKLITISDVMPNPIPHKDPLLFDDRKRIIEVIKLNGIGKFHFVTGEEKTLIDSLKRALSIHDEPPTKLVNVFGDLIYEKAQSLNSRVLLSGYGGDDVVSYQGYFFYEELLRTGKWKTLWNEIKLKTNRDKSSVLRKLANILISSFTSLSSSKYQYFKSRFVNRKTYNTTLSRIRNNFIRTEVSEKYNIEKRALEDKIHNFKGKTVNEKIASRLTHPTVLHHRLEYCNLSTAHNRIEYRYPLLDLDLIEFFVSIPSTEKVKNGWGRYLFRNASKGLIPDSIRWSSTKSGSSSPSFLWRMFRDKKLMINALERIPEGSKVHHYVDLEKYIKQVTLLANQEKFNNYKGNRVYLLQQFLDRI